MELCSPHLQPMNPACELSHCLSWAGLCSTAKAQIPWAEQDRLAVSPQPAQCQGCSLLRVEPELPPFPDSSRD